MTDFNIYNSDDDPFDFENYFAGTDTSTDIVTEEDDAPPSDLFRQAFRFFDFNQRVLNKDVRNMEVDLDRRSARELVSLYYDLQKARMAYRNQVRDLQKAGSPHDLLNYYAHTLEMLEKSLVGPLDYFGDQFIVGQWAKSQYGIGPVITAGLVAHIDIEKAPTAGSVWRYAGIDPTVKWEKGQKRPFNAQLKTLTWKIGQSFMKFSNRDQCFYGHLYKQDKARRLAKNEAGDYAEFAQQILTSKKWGNNPTRTYLESGKLPPAQIDAQARRFAAKIFLSHYHAVAYQAHHGTPAPRPYIIEHGGHVHEIAIPNNPFA